MNVMLHPLAWEIASVVALCIAIGVAVWRKHYPGALVISVFLIIMLGELADRYKMQQEIDYVQFAGNCYANWKQDIPLSDECIDDDSWRERFGVE